MQYEFRKRLQEYDLFACMGHVMIFVHWYMGYMVTNVSLARIDKSCSIRQALRNEATSSRYKGRKVVLLSILLWKLGIATG